MIKTFDVSGDIRGNNYYTRTYARIYCAILQDELQAKISGRVFNCPYATWYNSKLSISKHWNFPTKTIEG